MDGWVSVRDVATAFAAGQSLDAVKFLAIAAPEAHHVVVDLALSPAFAVESDSDVFLLARLVRVVDVAALGLFEVEEAGASRPVPGDKLRRQ